METTNFNKGLRLVAQLDDPCYSYLDFCGDHLSWQWRPHIAGCKMFLTLLRAELAVLTHFFCKMYQWYI